ncbi:MAG: hypothetical protein RJA81_1403, partial [Planctomycetota bacterium]
MFRKSTALKLTVLAHCLLSLVSTAGQAHENKLKELVVFPTEISLSNQEDRQSMVIQAIYENGLTSDVTLQAKLGLENPALAKIENAIIKPLSDGETKLNVEFEGVSLNIPLKVNNAKTTLPISFRMDVMPVFMKANCNTGSCHGAARGKDGFRLSLFGYDPEGDHHRLTREMPGRRINLAVPAESTVLEKAVGSVQHTGGKRIEPGSEMYQSVIRWIEAGAPNDDVSKLPKLVDVQIAPKQAVMDGKDSTQRLSVIAKYSDGTDRDVTSLSVFLTNNETSANVSQNGIVTAGERGEAFVMARFDTFTVGSQFLVLPKGLQ